MRQREFWLWAVRSMLVQMVVVFAFSVIIFFTVRPLWKAAGINFVFMYAMLQMTYVCPWCRTDDHSKHYVCKRKIAWGILGACRCQFFGGP